MNRERLLERFLRYVRVHTTAREGAKTYPSSEGQLELGRMLVDELLQMGITDASQDDHGIVMATVPSTADHDVPVVAFNAHLDTSPETSGDQVKPQVIQRYQGGSIVLPGDASKVISVEENPELQQLVGATIITTDGTTLLGGDDKAGIAIIMELTQSLLEDPSIIHGPVRIMFTCDEEIGHGVDYVDLDRLNAHVCYTFDGGGANDIDVETFSADAADVVIRGVNIHPSIARGRMVNALRAAGAFLDRLPRDMAPETTDGRQGFIHPYAMSGGVAQVDLRIILRDFETSALSHHADRLRAIASDVESLYPGCSVSVRTRAQYRNLGDGLKKEPRAVEFAKAAHEALGRTPRLSIIRGGTDGSLLTEKGLPTPNLSSGQHNPHSPLEWACLDEMMAAAEIGREICKQWAKATS